MKKITVKSISRATGMTSRDIIDTLNRLHFIDSKERRQVLYVDWSLARCVYEKAKNNPTRIWLDDSCLRWHPIVHSPVRCLANFESFDDSSKTKLKDKKIDELLINPKTISLPARKLDVANKSKTNRNDKKLAIVRNSAIKRLADEDGVKQSTEKRCRSARANRKRLRNLSSSSSLSSILSVGIIEDTVKVTKSNRKQTPAPKSRLFKKQKSSISEGERKPAAVNMTTCRAEGKRPSRFDSTSQSSESDNSVVLSRFNGKRRRKPPSSTKSAGGDGAKHKKRRPSRGQKRSSKQTRCLVEDELLLPPTKKPDISNTTDKLYVTQSVTPMSVESAVIVEAQLQPEDTDDSCVDDFPHHLHPIAAVGESLTSVSLPELTDALPASSDKPTVAPVLLESTTADICTLPSAGTATLEPTTSNETTSLNDETAAAPAAVTAVPSVEEPPTLTRVMNESDVDTDTEIEQLTKNTDKPPDLSPMNNYHPATAEDDSDASDDAGPASGAGLSMTAPPVIDLMTPDGRLPPSAGSSPAAKTMAATTASVSGVLDLHSAAASGKPSSIPEDDTMVNLGGDANDTDEVTADIGDTELIKGADNKRATARKQTKSTAKKTLPLLTSPVQSRPTLAAPVAAAVANSAPPLVSPHKLATAPFQPIALPPATSLRLASPSLAQPPPTLAQGPPAMDSTRPITTTPSSARPPLQSPSILTSNAGYTAVSASTLQNQQSMSTLDMSSACSSSSSSSSRPQLLTSQLRPAANNTSSPSRSHQTRGKHASQQQVQRPADYGVAASASASSATYAAGRVNGAYEQAAASSMAQQPHQLPSCMESPRAGGVGSTAGQQQQQRRSVDQIQPLSAPVQPSAYQTAAAAAPFLANPAAPYFGLTSLAPPTAQQQASVAYFSAAVDYRTGLMAPHGAAAAAISSCQQQQQRSMLQSQPTQSHQQIQQQSQVQQNSHHHSSRTSSSSKTPHVQQQQSTATGSTAAANCYYNSGILPSAATGSAGGGGSSRSSVSSADKQQRQSTTYGNSGGNGGGRQQQQAYHGVGATQHSRNSQAATAALMTPQSAAASVFSASGAYQPFAPTPFTSAHQYHQVQSQYYNHHAAAAAASYKFGAPDIVANGNLYVNSYMPQPNYYFAAAAANAAAAAPFLGPTAQMPVGVMGFGPPPTAATGGSMHAATGGFHSQSMGGPTAGDFSAARNAAAAQGVYGHPAAAGYYGNYFPGTVVQSMMRK